LAEVEVVYLSENSLSLYEKHKFNAFAQRNDRILDRNYVLVMKIEVRKCSGKRSFAGK